MSEIRGHVASGFEPVRDVFAETFEAGEELGAGFSAILDGEVIVDIPPTLDDEKLFEAMAENPKLIQRPIGINGDKAVLGRPNEKLLEIT